MPASAKNHLVAYAVKEIAGDRSIFTKIGAAFPHKEGPGFNIELDALPVGSRIVILPPRQDDATSKEPVNA
jgi:hypothetical protein